MSTLAPEDIETGRSVTNNVSKQLRTTKRTHDETVSSTSKISKENHSMTTPSDPELFNFSRKVRPTINAAQPSIVLPTPPSFVLPAVPPANILPSIQTTNRMMDESLPSTIDTIEPVPRLHPPESEEVTVQFCEESDEPNVIPASPTTKKKRRNDLRHIFRRCYESQPFRPSQPNVSQILAESSDPEEMLD